jgi:multisubunit Na+/H+ antiporter MnhE subunit
MVRSLEFSFVTVVFGLVVGLVVGLVLGRVFFLDI